jgi:hypothetical protein
MVHFLFRFVPNPKFYWSHILRIKIETPIHLNRLKIGRPALTDSHFKDEFTTSDTLGSLSDEADDKLFSELLYLLMSQGVRQESNCEMIEDNGDSIEVDGEIYRID